MSWTDGMGLEVSLLRTFPLWWAGLDFNYSRLVRQNENHLRAVTRPKSYGAGLGNLHVQTL